MRAFFSNDLGPAVNVQEAASLTRSRLNHISLLRAAYKRKLHIARTFRRRVGILYFEIRVEEDDDELVAFGVVRDIRSRPARRAHIVWHPTRRGQFVVVIFLKGRGLLGNVGNVGK